jgi:hypothetical protein
MTKLTETTQDCPALAEAILPNGQTLFCQFDNYDDLKNFQIESGGKPCLVHYYPCHIEPSKAFLKNFQIESGGKPCLVQYDRDNNVKLIQHNYIRESLDWRKEWNGYDMYLERPWHFLQVMFNADMHLVMTELFNELKSDNWQTDNRKRLIKFNSNKREFNLVKIDYPVVNQNIGNGLNESMGVIV